MAASRRRLAVASTWASDAATRSLVGWFGEAIKIARHRSEPDREPTVDTVTEWPGDVVRSGQLRNRARPVQRGEQDVALESRSTTAM